MNTSTTRNQTSIELGDTVPTVTITREFDAPVAHLFRAWTEGDMVARWLGPRSQTSPIAPAGKGAPVAGSTMRVCCPSSAAPQLTRIRPPSLGEAEARTRAPKLETYFTEGLKKRTEIVVAPTYEALAKDLLEQERVSPSEANGIVTEAK